MPGREIDIIVHGPPGSAPPVLAAALRDGLVELGRDPGGIRLIDRGGDPGVDAMESLAGRGGDGDVVSTCTPVFIQAPLLRGKGRTHREFTPIARLVADRFLLVVRSDAGWAADADGYLAHIRSSPTRTAGYFKGGINHLLALAIAEATGADVTFEVVENEPAVWAKLRQGAIDWGVGVLAELQPHLADGSLRTIAVLDDGRHAALPALPMLGECGAPVTFKLWRGLLAPARLNEERQAEWHALVERLAQTKAWKSYLAVNGQQPALLCGEPFARFLEEEWGWYEKHLGLAGLLPGR